MGVFVRASRRGRSAIKAYYRASRATNSVAKSVARAKAKGNYSVAGQRTRLLKRLKAKSEVAKSTVHIKQKAGGRIPHRWF